MILLNGAYESPGDQSQNAREFLDTNNKMETIIEARAEDTNEMSFGGNGYGQMAPMIQYGVRCDQA